MILPKTYQEAKQLPMEATTHGILPNGAAVRRQKRKKKIQLHRSRVVIDLSNGCAYLQPQLKEALPPRLSGS